MTSGPGGQVGDADLVEVVAAAIVVDGRVLAARRTRPAALAGGWEFPGGKVEPSEDGAAALAREIREELSVEVAVGAVLGVASDARIRLVLHAATLTDGEVPAAGADHDEVRLLDASELDGVAWLPIDRELLACVRGLLGAE